MNQNSALDVYTKRSQLFTFVTPEEVKINTGLAANVNDDNIYIPIVTATNIYIKPILGDTLFNNLKTHFIAVNRDPNMLPDGSTLPDNINYKELYEKMYLPLIWWAYIESLINIAVKVEEKGIMYNGSSFSENAELSGYNQVNNRQKSIAENYTDEFKCYVKETILDKTLKDEQQTSGTTEYAIYFPSMSTNCKNC